MLALVGVLAGCTGPLASGGDQPEPGKDWFGNGDPRGGACDAREALSRSRPLYNPATGGRPSMVPAGWSWVVITLKLHAISIDPETKWFNVNHCVPVRTHVYARQDGNPTPVKMNTGTGSVTPLPYDGVKTTPWVTSYFIFGYNPDGWQGPPPTYKIDFVSTWDSTFDNTSARRPNELVCHIGIGGGYELVEARSNELARGRLTADCKHTGNHYWAS